MTKVRTLSVWTVAVATVLTWNAVARSQTATPGVPTWNQNALDNVSAGALASRSPGNMVGAGVVRAQEAADFARGGIEIVETSRPISPRATFLVEAIKIVFVQLNRTLLYLGNILLERAGLSPLVPIDVSPTTPTDAADGTTADGTTDGVDAADVPDVVSDQ